MLLQSINALVILPSVIRLSLSPQLGCEQPASHGYINSNAQQLQAAAEDQTFHSLL